MAAARRETACSRRSRRHTYPTCLVLCSHDSGNLDALNVTCNPTTAIRNGLHVKPRPFKIVELNRCEIVPYEEMRCEPVREMVGDSRNYTRLQGSSRRGTLTRVFAPIAVSIVFLHALAADDKSVTVTLKCRAMQGKPAARVRILEGTALGVIASRAYSPGVFDSDGECRLELDPGEYVFETALIQGDTIYALRTPSRRISKDSVFELQSGAPQPLTINSNIDESLNIQELAVRSAAETGEMEWKSRGDGSPRLVLTPGQEYRIRALGGN